METDGEQNQQGASANGSPSSGTSSRPSAMNSMSLYERQAVQVGCIFVCLCAHLTLLWLQEAHMLPALTVKTLAAAWQQSVLVYLCLCFKIYVRVSCRNEPLTCAELMEALWFSHHSVTPLSHLSFSPRRFNLASHTRLAAARCFARTSGSWQEVLFRSFPLPLLATDFFLLAFFTPLWFCRCYVSSVLLPS